MNNLFRQENGQIAFLLVMVLPVVFLLFALSLDAGVWYLDHRQAQNQVDAAALAAVIALPANPIATVDTWLTKHGSGHEELCDPDVNGPYPQYLDRYPVGGDGTPDTIRVCIRRQSPAIFSQLAGLPFVYVSSVAGAIIVGQSAPYAIFANHDCPDGALPPFSFQGRSPSSAARCTPTATW